MNKLHNKHILYYCLVFLITFSKISYAYIDPGSGSYMFQLIIGTILGALYVIKLYWKNIKSKFLALFIKGKKIEKE